MQPPKKMAIVVFGSRARIGFRYRVEKNDQEELERIGNEDFLGVLEDQGIIRNPPACRVVFESLKGVSSLGWTEARRDATAY